MSACELTCSERASATTKTERRREQNNRRGRKHISGVLSPCLASAIARLLPVYSLSLFRYSSASRAGTRVARGSSARVELLRSDAARPLDLSVRKENVTDSVTHWIQCIRYSVHRGIYGRGRLYSSSRLRTRARKRRRDQCRWCSVCVCVHRRLQQAFFSCSRSSRPAAECFSPSPSFPPASRGAALVLLLQQLSSHEISAPIVISRALRGCCCCCCSFRPQISRGLQ